MPSTFARRYVATVIERDATFDIFLRDTKLERWVTMVDSASPEPAFALSIAEGPLATVAHDATLLMGAAEAMGAVYKSLGELAIMLLRRDLDAAREAIGAE